MEMHDESFLELDVEEQLFAAVVHWPLVDCEKLLFKTHNLDTVNGSGRSLLHVAIRLGKLDWVEGLLERGANPGLRDSKGSSPLDVAEEMARKHPKSADRELIARFTRLANCMVHKSRIGAADSTSSQQHHVAASGDGVAEVGDNLAKVRLEPDLEAVRSIFTGMSGQLDAIQSSLDSFKSEASTRMGGMSQQLLSTSGEINSAKERIQTLSRNVSVLKATDRLIHSDLAVMNEVLSQRLSSTSDEISAVKVNLDTVSSHTASLVETVNVLRTEVSSIASWITSMSKQVEVTKQNVIHGNVTLSTQVSLLSESVKETKGGIAARDTLLETLESSITSLAQEMRAKAVPKLQPARQESAAPRAVPVEEEEEEYEDEEEEDDEEETDEEDEEEEEVEDNTVQEIGAASALAASVVPLVEKFTQAFCVQSLMSKTWIYNGDEAKVEEIRGFYNKLYGFGPMISCILTFLACQPQVQISIDAESKTIEGMKESFVDHDGFTRSGTSTSSFPVFSEKKVYVGGEISYRSCEEEVTSHLARALAQLSFYLVFDNEGRPYRKNERHLEKKMEDVFAAIRRRKYEQKEWLNWYIYNALVVYTQPAKETIVMSAVPGIIAAYKGEAGIKSLKEEFPLLIDFYTTHVMPALQQAVVQGV